MIFSSCVPFLQNYIVFFFFRMFEPLHLATSEKIYPSNEGFYVVIISSIINEFRKYNFSK